MAKTKAANGKAMTKTELFDTIAGQTELNRRQVSEVFDVLGETIQTALSRKGEGVFVLPGLLKITKVLKPAVKGGVKKTNPFTGEDMVTKSKPARNVVKVRPLKKLKDMV